MGFPVGDWQFWVVTLAAALATGWLLRGPVRRLALLLRGKRPRPQRRATLTIDGEPARSPRR